MVGWWVVLNVWLEGRFVIEAWRAHLCREKRCLVADGESVVDMFVCGIAVVGHRRQLHCGRIRMGSRKALAEPPKSEIWMAKEGR